LHSLKLDSFAPLDLIKERSVCPKCKLTRKYFCPLCYISFADKIPHVKLPINVTVLQHPKEKPEQSSINPLKILSPDQFEIHRTRNITPNVKIDPTNTILLYPREDAKLITDISASEWSKISNILLIDCTWRQVNNYLDLKKIKQLPAVKLSSSKTTFWRYQKNASDNLSTAEAIYIFFKELEAHLNKDKKDYVYDGKYDNLLYFYAYSYNQIQAKYLKAQKPVFFILYDAKSSHE